MIGLEEAVQRILAALPAPGSESVRLRGALGRVLLDSASSNVDLPPFDNSAMDGYAVRAEDVSNAKPASPVPLRLIGRIEAGQTSSIHVGKGECVRLFTGSPMPAGADAVVMQEDTRVEKAQPDAVAILDGVKPWESVRLRGEDVRTGAVVARSGERITAALIGLLAATGCPELRAGKQPRVALLATGSELVEPGEPLSFGQIYESNRLMLFALAKDAGAVPEICPVVRDDLSTTRDALQSAFERSDIVVTSGGVSVGEMDFVKQAFEQSSGQLEFWKVNIRPGRPFVFGRTGDGKFLFGLPGNPVSAFVTFLLLVRPALLKWQGATETNLTPLPGVLAEALRNDGNRRHFIRVHLRPDGKVVSTGTQASHILSSLAASNALVDAAPATVLAAGTNVNVLTW